MALHHRNVNGEAASTVMSRSMRPYSHDGKRAAEYGMFGFVRERQRRLAAGIVPSNTYVTVMTSSW